MGLCPIKPRTYINYLLTLPPFIILIYYMGLYEYKNNPVNSIDYVLSPPEDSGGISAYDLEFPSPFTTGVERNHGSS